MPLIRGQTKTLTFIVAIHKTGMVASPHKRKTNWMPVRDEISPAPKILIRGTVDIQVFD
jgi:hypothetical protein